MRFFAVLILSLMLLCGCGSKEDLTGDVTVISPDDVSLEAGNSEDGRRQRKSVCGIAGTA